ncbi:MAG: hypothetical protein LBE04_03330 [Prevotellaceae bacterium]|jgi:hypothetical protein|nr:hypothetical protein [Prevotellaceae bacterium]
MEKIEKEKIEKQEVIVNYKGSGVKTLKGFGVLFFVLGSLALLVSIIGVIGMRILTEIFLISIILFFFGAVCTGLSCIALVVLCKREMLCQQYNFMSCESGESGESGMLQTRLKFIFPR